MNKQVRRAVRNVPFARAANRVRVRRDLKILEALPAYAPNSAGYPEVRSAMALHAANRSIELVGQLADHVEARGLSVVDPVEFWAGAADHGAVGRLDELLRRHGSDKSTDHDYHLVYAGILDSMPQGSSLLEIGLGTNDESIVSTMGRLARPGASLRAFRDYLPTSAVFGADIDREILFQEDRITTTWVDQTSTESVRALEAQLPDDVHLIIDDGLHSPDANMQVLLLGLRIMPVHGWLVIEDIIPAAQDFWRVVAALLPNHFEATLVRAKGGDLFVVRRTS
ncbi:hypothetical protein [Nocardioides zhouii]|uniref:Uncharacterized protein n=1 Tax=Nocardioides zhouii TaxID=1168729 RepID=A0A4V1RQ41_9ACTN|nr:hypothetical protein [Nocardioides zhouii]RYC11537.1 hypothetical protein EUA94_09250 [Nocardioides zhouii]